MELARHHLTPSLHPEGKTEGIITMITHTYKRLIVVCYYFNYLIF